MKNEISKQEKELDKNIRRYNSSGKLGPIVKTGLGVGVDMGLTYLGTKIPGMDTYLLASVGAGVNEIIDQASDSALAAYQNYKQKKFLDSIIEYKGILPEDKIKKIADIPVIIEMGRTMEVINRLATDQKVIYLCNCFDNYFLREDHFNDVDRYEEFLWHLDTLSYREIDILTELYKLEKTSDFRKYHSPNGESLNGLSKHSIYCNVLGQIAQEKWKMSQGELDGILAGLCRSGFLKEEVGAYLDYTGGIYYTTEYFEVFLTYIMPELTYETTENGR